MLVIIGVPAAVWAAVVSWDVKWKISSVNNERVHYI